MKRVIAVIICLMLFLTACSGNSKLDESNINSYVGAGELTVINTLVKSNGFFVEEVFVANSLPVDSENTVETENGTFAPVASDKFESYADFEKKIRSTYTEAASNEILSQNKYTEINGKLYLNLNHETDTTEKYLLDWSEVTAEAIINAEGKFEITAKVKNGSGFTKNVTLYAVNENGNIRLENIYS